MPTNARRTTDWDTPHTSPGTSRRRSGKPTVNRVVRDGRLQNAALADGGTPDRPGQIVVLADSRARKRPVRGRQRTGRPLERPVRDRRRPARVRRPPDRVQRRLIQVQQRLVSGVAHGRAQQTRGPLILPKQEVEAGHALRLAPGTNPGNARRMHTDRIAPTLQTRANRTGAPWSAASSSLVSGSWYI